MNDELFKYPFSKPAVQFYDVNNVILRGSKTSVQFHAIEFVWDRVDSRKEKNVRQTNGRKRRR